MKISKFLPVLHRLFLLGLIFLVADFEFVLVVTILSCYPVFHSGMYFIAVEGRY